MTIRQLDRSEIRHTAKTLGLGPYASRGRYFLHDVSTVRRIATVSGARRGDHVLDVGAGMGALTLALLGKGAAVTAVEIDPTLAQQLPITIAEHSHSEIDRLRVLHRDAMTLRREEVPAEPTVLVASLPAHLADTALLHLLTEFPTLRTVLLITESGLTDRLAAEPGHPKYHPTGAKLRFFGTVARYGLVSPSAWWPIPRSYHGLLGVHRDQRHPRVTDAASRAEVFDLIDIAFTHRRTTVRTAFAPWAGSGSESATRLLTASIDPARRADDLGIDDFIRLQHRSPHTPPRPPLRGCPPPRTREGT